MHKITININQSIYEHIMFFLKSLPKHLINIDSEIKISDDSQLKNNTKAFGILTGRVKDPVQWQNHIREESDRDVYGELSK